jgi:type 2 lantibiotic biosynthesis protein LanM
MHRLVLLTGLPRLRPASGSDRTCFDVVPFADILDPLVARATSGLFARIGTIEPLSAGCLARLQRALLSLLADLSLSTLYIEFARVRQYSRFAGDVGALHRLFGKYPGFPNLIECAIGRWVEATAEFILRLRDDQRMIVQEFAGGCDPGSILELTTGLSDRHHGGRTTIAVRYASGLQLIYKPRETGTERFFHDLVEWLNERDPPYGWRAPSVVARADYGWVEFVSNDSCASMAEAQLYYRRCGALLLLLYLLQFSDGHFQNLVACGAFPVIVDTETLLQPLAAGAGGRVRTVLSTGLLPGGKVLMDHIYEVSAFGAAFEQTVEVGIPQWRNVGTDEMELEFVKATLPVHSNVPRVAGAPVPPDEYLGDVVDGFRAAGRFVIDLKSELLQRDGPLAGTDRLCVRVALRDSMEYYLALNASIDPALLSRGGDRERAWDRLQAVPGSDARVLAAEKECLRQLDIPRFTCVAGSTSLDLRNGRKIPRRFRHSGVARMTQALLNLDAETVERQVELIRSSWSLGRLTRMISAAVEIT